MGETSTPSALEKLVGRLEREEFDLIAVGRALLTDPDRARKIRARDSTGPKFFRGRHGHSELTEAIQSFGGAANTRCATWRSIACPTRATLHVASTITHRFGSAAAIEAKPFATRA